MEAVSPIETSDNINQTTKRNIPVDSNLKTRRKNLKYYLVLRLYPIKQNIKTCVI